MSFTACTHLDNVPTCSGTSHTGPEVCICKSADNSECWPRIWNIHSAAHARLTLRAGTPPSGVEGVYDFKHDTAGTQGAGHHVDGTHVAYTGGPVTFLIHYSSGGVDTVATVVMEQPEGC